MPADPIDDKLANLKNLLSRPKGSSNAAFWAKFIFHYLKYQLAAKERALAEARTEIALAKFRGQHVDDAHIAMISDEEKKYIEQAKQYVALKKQ